jgi:hypothetical protein
MCGKPFLVLQRRALKNWSPDRIVTPVNQARPKRCGLMKTSIKGPPTVFIDLLGIFSVSATSRRIHAFGGLGADTTIFSLATNQQIREPLLLRFGFFSARRKRLGMLRQPQHERKTHNHLTHRTVRSFVRLRTGSRRTNGAFFSRPAKTRQFFVISVRFPTSGRGDWTI